MRSDWHALEFTKTRGWEPRDRTSDDFGDFDGLVAWCERRGIVSYVRARRYRQTAQRRPVDASATLAEVRALRQLAYEVLCRVSAGRLPTPEQLDAVATWARRFDDARHLVASRAGVRWEWRLDDHRLDHLIAQVAWSLADLLVSPELARVRLCDGDDCGWLFIDASRAASRRWCDMSDCGNLAKVRHFRARMRAARS